MTSDAPGDLIQPAPTVSLHKRAVTKD